MVELLREDKALQLVEFDPKVTSADTWQPFQSMEKFLDNKRLQGERNQPVQPRFPGEDRPPLSAKPLDNQ